MAKERVVPKVYERVFTTKKTYTILNSGRDAGKSTILAMLVEKHLFHYPYDIIAMRANSSDMRKSVFSAILKQLEKDGLKMFVDTYTRPVRIVNRLNGNTVHFEGIGGSDLSRTRSAEPDKEVSLIIIEETQQLPNQSNLDHALATYRRHLVKDLGRVVMAFNPEPQNSHWMNEYFRINQSNPLFLCIKSSYKDIAKLLNVVDKQAIEMEKILNPSNYRQLYLGETNGLFGGVYHTFNRDIHLIKRTKVEEMIKEIGIYQMLVGLDTAVTRDRTAVIPMLILRNGQCIVTEYLYHNPQKHGQLPDEKLVTQYIYPFLEEMEKKYKLDLGRKPIHLVVDSANANVVKTLQYHNVRSRYRIWAYTQKKIFEMARIVQDAFSKNVVYILDNGGIFNYVTGRKEHNYHPLVTALESVVWDEKGNGFDPIVPNDSTDALTYALATYYKNPHNLTFPTRYKYYENK